MPSRGASSPVIRTVFVANRGEIAVRIRRTTDRLGLRAVVPGEDGHPPVDLLDATIVVGAAVASGADAVHPGFGFLSENADFADRVVAAGLRWVGPPATAIRALGDKAAARRLAAGLDIPIVAGYDEADQSDAALRDAARRIGWPLIVKPAAGGGGKGMRIVREDAAFDAAIASARREARTAFGDDRLILERFLEGPRHVEVQVLFDAHGAGVQLGERDCSLQRRHQKILEETPSPGVDPELRAKLGAAALALAGSVGYVSAGTCEFLVDDDGQPYFLEMNTRLQVEHPVTEMATGRDLVADQLRIAAGEPLGFDQASIDVRLAVGTHAIEVRLYAEDADDGFVPATGRVERLVWPTGTDRHVRVDPGIELGTDVDDRFDPMLAKIIAAGRDRADALRRLEAALDGTTVLGLTTNLRFLRWLVRQPVVRAGEARIDTLDRIWPADAPARVGVPPDAAWSTAARLLDRAGPAEQGGAAADGRSTDPDPWAGGWRLNARPRIRIAAEDGTERTVEVPIDPLGVQPAAVVGPDGSVHVDIGGRSVAFRVAPAPDVERAARAAGHHGPTSGEVVSPMPGSVLAVHVAVGATVEAGDPIVTLEAMKMEHVVVAPVAGTIVELAVRVADQVRRGQILAQTG